MKWHDYVMAWRSMAKAKGLDPRKEQEAVTELVHTFRNMEYGDNTAVHVLSEAMWNKDNRPYYDLYPSVAEAFTKVDLSKIRSEHVKLPMKRLMVRFQVGHELFGKVRSFLVSEADAKVNRNKGILVAINDGSMMDVNGVSVNIHTVNCVVLQEGLTISDQLERAKRAYVPGDTITIDQDMIEQVYKVLITLCLLRDNPDLIEPEPLEADRAKYDATYGSPEEQARLLEKAARRGKKAWAVGKHIEVAPGFRCPHFAIRWMGKGILEPVLRPIKGCLVKRRQVEEVPTDWLGSESETA